MLGGCGPEEGIVLLAMLLMQESWMLLDGGLFVGEE